MSLVFPAEFAAHLPQRIRTAIEAGLQVVIPLTTKGDLLVSTASMVARLGVGANDKVLTADSTAAEGVAWKDAPGAGGGETNTASNVGVGGVGVFKQKTGVDLEFRNVNAASAKITVALDAGNNEIDLDVSEANLTLDNIGGTLGISKGGTGQTGATAAFDALAPGTTKGDLLVFNGTDHVRLAVGTDGQRLESDSAQAAGVKWADAGGGGGSSVVVWYTGVVVTVSKGSTSYLGTGGVAPLQVDGQIDWPVAGTIQSLRVYVKANSTGANGNTVKIYKGAADSGVGVTFDSGEIGWKKDDASTVSVAKADLISIQVVNQGSGGGAKDLNVATVAFEFVPD